MTEAGLARIEAAKKSGVWDNGNRSEVSVEICEEFAAALGRNARARENFEKLAASYRRNYAAWINSAKGESTRAKRIREAMTLLEQGSKPGMK